MGGIGDDRAFKLLNYLFGSVSYSNPSSYYFALSSTEPSSAAGNVTEPVGMGYARVQVVNDITRWPAVSNRTKSNGLAITWPQATGDWGLLTHFAIYTHATLIDQQYFIGWGALTEPVNPTSDSLPLSFAAGALAIPFPLL
jgi:hypothetical protein